MVTRRDLLIVVSSSVASLCPLWAGAQRATAGAPRIGFISTTATTYPGYPAFRETLGQLGYVEGKTIHIESRFAAGQLDRLPGLAAELVGLDVDVIAAIGAVTVRAVRQATTTVPVVFTVVLDPVADGLVSNAERPGGNITGATNFDPAQARAQMQLLKQVIPGLSRVAILGDAGVPDLLDRASREAALAEGLRPQAIRLQGATQDIDKVFAAIREERAEAVLCLEVPAVGFHAKRILALAAAARLPTLFPGDLAALNPMLAYGSSLIAAVRRMAGMVDRILKGDRPGDLAIEVVTRHTLAVNLRVAREVGVTIPPEVLARADRVIE